MKYTASASRNKIHFGSGGTRNADTDRATTRILFEVIRLLLSRCQLYVLKPLEKDDLTELLQYAVATDVMLKERKIELKETNAMFRFSGGDARKLLNILNWWQI